ncbi:MAG: putative DNA modification/repair radical SAM protein [bacterium]|nr:putative DNA modification/repair radical SAM protein [bacterium]
MNVEEKLAVLAAAAKYDVSCASSGSRRRNAGGGLGAATPAGCCHSWSDDGRCISLLKLLLTNRCVYDCAYCANRCSNNVPRAAFTVEEVVDLTVQFYRRNYIEGLFLSSGVERSPNYTMERMLEVVRRLRREEAFRGYIHVKAIPGADPELIRRAGFYADRISVNIELPSEVSLRRLAPDKARASILGPMQQIAHNITVNRDERKTFKRAPLFAPAGQSTQLIVSASPENDDRILLLAERLYQTYHLKRVYYSAYVPVNDDARLPWAPAPDMLREHRLYQADWLVRYYGFAAADVLDATEPNLDRELDPKCAWALRHLEQFPVEVNRADYETLLRVPGVGMRSAKRIVASRGQAALRIEDLDKLGVVMKRARYFITCGGRVPAELCLTPAAIRAQLLLGPAGRTSRPTLAEQPELFGEL